MPKAYFIGVKGVGMTALALAMQDKGWQVSGSDTAKSFITDNILASAGIMVKPLSSSLPAGLDLVVYSGAYAPSPTSVRTLPLAQALAEFIADRQVIAVAGVGGKTTTTAMLSVLMREAGRDVGYYVGTGSISGLPAPGAAGTDPYFVVEADEYAISKDDHRAKFALLSPRILITTNIIHDHPDIYPDKDATLAVFGELVRKLAPGSTWICNSQDPLTARLLDLQGPTLKETCLPDRQVKVVQYGTDHPLFPKLKLSVFGAHNRLDALAAVLAAIEAGLSPSIALSAISHYRGAKRRQEFVGEINGRLLYDDYGHHPEEIEATTRAFRAEFPTRRLVVIFESHTYSRTAVLFAEFARALALADLVFVMPIFESARERGAEHTITHQSLAKAVAKLGTNARPLSWDNAALRIAKESRPGDLLLTMGAGFVYKLHPQITKLL